MNKKEVVTLGILKRKKGTEWELVEVAVEGQTLADLTDVNVANKTNGYVMTYDSATGKTMLQALPVGQGSGATNLDGLSDVDVSTVIPSEGDTLQYVGGIWKSGATSSTSEDPDSEMFPTIQYIDLDGKTIGNFVLTKNDVKLGTVTLA